MSKLRPSEHGLIQMIDPGQDKPVAEIKTLQCCHCGKHWVPKPGSGIQRGWCMRCAGFICGAGCADACVPAEQMLENIEQGRPLDFRPIVGRVQHGK